MRISLDYQNCPISLLFATVLFLCKDAENLNTDLKYVNYYRILKYINNYRIFTLKNFINGIIKCLIHCNNRGIEISYYLVCDIKVLFHITVYYRILSSFLRLNNITISIV